MKIERKTRSSSNSPSCVEVVHFPARPIYLGEIAILLFNVFFRLSMLFSALRKEVRFAIRVQLELQLLVRTFSVCMFVSKRRNYPRWAAEGGIDDKGYGLEDEICARTNRIHFA